MPEEPGIVRCTLCGSALVTERFPEQPAPSTKASSNEAWPRSEGDLDNWELESDLRSVDRLVAALQMHDSPIAVPLAHAPHAPLLKSHLDALPLPSGGQPGTTNEPVASAPAPGPAENLGFIAWCCLCLGMMSLSCGSVLVIWSLAAGRGDLWSLGLPLALFGQAGIVMPILFQWQSRFKSPRRQTSGTTLTAAAPPVSPNLESSRSLWRTLPGESLHVHGAESASPHLLLSNLKDQLDLLEQQIARQT